MNLTLNQNLKNFVYVSNALPKSFCDTLVKDFEKNYSWEQHSWYDPKKGDYSHPDKELDVSPLKQEYVQEYFKLLQKPLEEYHYKHAFIEENQFNLISKLSLPRVNKYEPGTLMRLHFDHIHSIFDGKEKGIPSLSLVSVLNNEFEGGELVIRDTVYNLKKGDLIIFPSCFMFPHKVNEIKKGIRYGIVCWGY